MRLPRLLAGSAVTAVLLGTAACGLQAAEPKLELRDAMSDFAAGRAGTVTLSLPSSADDVRAFAEAADPSGGDTEMSDGDLQDLLSSSIDIGYDFGEDRDSDADDASRVVVHLEDLDAGELRTVGGQMYARADIDGLAAKFPDMQEGLDEFRAQVSGGGAAGIPEAVVAAANALLDGEWVSVDLQAYLEQMEAAVGGAPGDTGPSLSDDSSAKMRDLLGKALKSAVTSIERREADDQLGDHLVASLDLREAYTTLRSGLPGLFTGTTAEAMEQELPPASEVPDKQVDVSFWVRDGDLRRVELDVAQFLDEPAGHLVLRADMKAPTKITAPSDSVEFDLEALMSAYQPAGEDEPGAMLQPDAYEIATWIDEDVAGLAYTDGVEPSVDLLPDVLPYYEGIVKSLRITTVGERVQVTLLHESVCLTLSPDGTGQDIVDGPC